jgi:dihydrofolate synthase/folylpolyglutamate synthase
MTNRNAYSEALDYLYSFTNFEHKRPDQFTADKLDLARPFQLMERLGNPHQHFPAVHIAGTKGKGSVAAFCASALRAAGLRVGLYTSTHLQEFRDRIRILTPADPDGRISEGQLVELINRLKAAAAQVEGITWFELVTALGFMHFAQEQVDIAVVEVGLGGRLDATNVITPLVSVITSLSLDHTQLLGHTLPEIAYEKAGIIKPGVPVVTAPQPPEALARLTQIAAERKATLTVIGRDWQYQEVERTPTYQQIAITKSQIPNPKSQSFISNLQSPISISLGGSFQQTNAVVALAALAIIQPHFPSLTAAAIAEGFAHTEWPGRLQILHQSPGTPTVLVDCAHNEDSAAKLAHTLITDYSDYEQRWLVFGATADKNVTAMISHLFPIAAGTFVTAASHPRAATPGDLAQLAAELGYEVQAIPGVGNALQAACAGAGPHDLICITGSIFIVGDLLNQWDSLKSKLFQ